MDPNHLKKAAAFYGANIEDLQPAPGGNASEVFFARLADKEFVLRLIAPNEEITCRTLQAVQTWVRYLGQAGGPVAAPCPALDGELVKKIDTPEGEIAVCAVEKAPGRRAETLPIESWTAEILQAVGEAAGCLHRLAGSYQPASPELQRPPWDQIGTCFRPEPIPPDQNPILEKYQQVLEKVSSLPRSPQDFGMIHADFHGANFFIEPLQNTITVFDFDDCCLGWYVMDISMSLFDSLVLYSGTDRQAFAANYLKEFLKGYRREKPISTFWLEQIPNFLKLLEIGVYSQVYRYYDPQEPHSWVGKFMPGRRERILEDIPYIELDFSVFQD